MSLIILNELDVSTARHLRKEKNVNNVITFLDQNGYILAGHGKHSAVFKNKNPSSNIVIRINLKDDKSWLSYYELAYREQRKNRFFPRIGKIKLIQRRFNIWNLSIDKLYLVFMEKLVPLDHFLPDLYREIHYLGWRRSPILKKEYPEFFEFLKDIEQKRPSSVSEDVHGGNIMIRQKTKELVLTDPWY